MAIEPVRINKYLTVGARVDGNKYHIYTIANGRHVGTCRFALCNVPTYEEDEVQSIDELLSKYKVPENENEYVDAQSSLSMGEELFVHASNIAGWARNGYDWRLMDTRLGLPILSEIWKVDKNAEHALFDLVVQRWTNGNDGTRIALAQMADPEVLCILAKNKLIDLQDLRRALDSATKSSIRDGEIKRLMYIHGLMTEDAYFTGIETDPEEIASWRNAISYYKNKEGGIQILRDAFKNNTVHAVAESARQTSMRNERKTYLDPFDRTKARITRENVPSKWRWGFNDTSMMLSSIYYYDHSKFTDFFHPCYSEPIDYAAYIYSKGAMVPVEYSEIRFITSTYNAPGAERITRSKYKLVHHVSFPAKYKNIGDDIQVYQVDVADDVTHVFPYHVLYGNFTMSCILRHEDGTFEKKSVKFTSTRKYVKHYTQKKKK